MITINRISARDTGVPVPGSKSLTQRALVTAALAEGDSVIHNPLLSDDTRRMIDALRSLGAGIDHAGESLHVTGTGGMLSRPNASLFVGDNGTALRFLVSVVALAPDCITVDGTDRLRARPIGPLVAALERLGVHCDTGREGYAPVTVHGGGIAGGKTFFRDAASSQYISSLLIASPHARNDVDIELRGLTVSRPYIDMTIAVMNHFGVKVIRKGTNEYTVKAPQKYTGQRYLIEGDASSASYFFVAAAICKGRVKVDNVSPKTVQGDIDFLKLLETVGCHVDRGSDSISVTGSELHRGTMEFDMANMPDMVPSLAILSAFRPGQTVIKNVSHLRLKESDRLEALVTELNKIGIDAKELSDGLVINGGTPHGADIETYDDHRIAMSFAIAGLVTEGIKIKNHGCVKKSFPGFWNELDRLLL